MRCILILCLFSSFSGFSQHWKSFVIGVKGDTLNCVDMQGQKQGKWVMRYDELRGEPGYEEEGEFKDDRKEGVWRKYTLVGDLIALENFRWGNKDGICQYFNGFGEPLREERWKAINPDKQYDTIDVEDVDNPNNYKTVIVKNEGAGIRHGLWKYYDPASGLILKTENYVLGSLDGGGKGAPVAASASAESEKKSVPKPKEVLDYEKKNSGKKRIRVRDGSTVN